MIQRLQSVYMLLAAIALAVCFVFDEDMRPSGLTLCLAVISFFNIFLYKNRVRQARVCLGVMLAGIVYYIFLARGEDAEFRYVGAYDPEAGKLICYDADAVGAEDAQGLFEALNAGTPCDAAFTDLGNGKLLYEGEGTIELEYDLMGPES